MEMSSATTIMLIAVPLVIWRLYSRIRRLIGRQQSRAWRHWAAVILFPLLVILIALSARTSEWALAGLVAGLAVGVGLGIYGLKLTKFEKTSGAFFYTPNAHIGIALSLLLVGRIGYRVYQMATLSGPAAQQASQQFTRSPATTVIFGMMAGYFTCYAIGLLRWRQSVASVAAKA